MKITHVALCGPVTDNWSYQDNLLPKFHKRLGFEVSMITSKFIWGDQGEIKKDTRGSYINEHGIKTIRLQSAWKTTISSKLKKYKNVYSTLEKENPDILFIHGVQFLDMKKIVKYIDKHSNVIVYVDNHADFSNSATNWLSKNILHKRLWKNMAKKIEPYTKKYYGVLPARVDFLNEVYNIPKEKIELLVMGIDDDQVENLKEKFDRDKFREKFGISSDDFLIVTGGKIDSAKKQTLLLMEAVQNINDKNVKLIVFGSVEKELREKVQQLADGKKIQYLGWIDPKECNKYFYSSDLVIFPGRHSVFWEQVAGLGRPLVVKFWEGTTHIDAGGNCKFLYEDNTTEIQKVVEDLLNRKKNYDKMLQIAKSKAQKNFLYSNIAKQSLELK